MGGADGSSPYFISSFLARRPAPSRGREQRWVRTIDERFSGRTARIFYVGAIHPKQARG